MANVVVEKIETVILSLTMDAARELEGLLTSAATLEGGDPLSEIYEALVGVTGPEIPDFGYNEATGLFEKKEEE